MSHISMHQALSSVIASVAIADAAISQSARFPGFFTLCLAASSFWSIYCEAKMLAAKAMLIAAISALFFISYGLLPTSMKLPFGNLVGQAYFVFLGLCLPSIPIFVATTVYRSDHIVALSQLILWLYLCRFQFDMMVRLLTWDA